MKVINLPANQTFEKLTNELIDNVKNVMLNKDFYKELIKEVEVYNAPDKFKTHNFVILYKEVAIDVDSYTHAHDLFNISGLDQQDYLLNIVDPTNNIKTFNLKRFNTKLDHYKKAIDKYFENYNDFLIARNNILKDYLNKGIKLIKTDSTSQFAYYTDLYTEYISIRPDQNKEVTTSTFRYVHNFTQYAFFIDNIINNTIPTLEDCLINLKNTDRGELLKTMLKPHNIINLTFTNDNKTFELKKNTKDYKEYSLYENDTPIDTYRMKTADFVKLIQTIRNL